MSTIKEDKQHVIETMQRDQDLSNEMAKNSDTALSVLVRELQSFAESNAVGGSQYKMLQPLLLNKQPNRAQANQIKRLIAEIKLNGNADDDYIKQIANTAGTNYKISNEAYVSSLIGAVMALKLQKDNVAQAKYVSEDTEAEVNYITGENGDLSGKPKAAVSKEMPSYVTTTDEKGNTLLSNNHFAAVSAVSMMSTAVNSKIRQGITLDEFAKFLNGANIKAATVSKHDAAAHTGKKTPIQYDLSGGLQRYDADLIRNYRTTSAIMHSQFKGNLADKYGFKKATIINELGACAYCTTHIGFVYDVADAIQMVPQHNSCRCEVKLIGDGIDTSDLDLDIDSNDD